MALYEYVCEDCGYTFDEFLPMEDRDNPTKEPCPECKTGTVIKPLSKLTVCDSVRVGLRRPDSGFKEVQAKIAQHHPHHNMNMR